MRTGYELKVVRVEDLRDFPHRLKRTSDAAQQRLFGTFQEFGMTPPIFNEQLGYILDGHARVEALRQAGIAEIQALTVRCDYVEHLMRTIALQAPYATFDSASLQQALVIIDAAGEDVDYTGLTPTKIGKLLYGQSWSAMEMAS